VELGQAVVPGFGSCSVRPASLLRKSILDIGQLASATADCTATYKLRARLIPKEYDFVSNSYGNGVEDLKLASLPIRRQPA
jgi:hypothetical protein